MKSEQKQRYRDCSRSRRMRAITMLARAAIGATFLLLLSASPASALCVTDGQGPCYRFWKVDAVFVAQVQEMVPLPEPAVETPAGTFRVVGEYRLRVRVTEAFRGVKAGAVITLFAPDGVCGGVNAEDGGELFVYGSHNKAGELWAQGCGESKPLEDADADLAYARSVSAVGPGALVYGDVTQVEDRTGGALDFSQIGNVRVRVHGRNFEAETVTDQDGNYSIALPDSGGYTVEVIPPSGFADRLGNGRVQFVIGDRRSCYSVTFQLRRNGRIRGSVIDRDGQPMANLVVRAGDSQGFSKTDASGRFDIGPLGPGVYSVAARTGGANELKFETSELVEVGEGKATVLSPLVAVASNLVVLSIDVSGPADSNLLVLVRSQSTGDDLGEPVPADSLPVRFLVEKDQTFEIVAATMTHSAKSTVRARAAVTEVTLKLRPSQEQR